jgi:hypothetical protein
MRQFSVGEVVTWIPDLLLRWETHGNYRIVATMPDRDGHHMYRIKSPLEEYERVVKGDLLAKSNGYLPEQVPAPVSRRSSINTADSATRLSAWGQQKPSARLASSR